MLKDFVKMWKYVSLFLSIIFISNSGFCQGGKKGSAPSIAAKRTDATEISGKTFVIPSEYNGFNTQMLRGPSWHEDGFTEKVKMLHPKLLRYPGGTVSSYWNWHTGWLKEGIDLKFDWAKIKKNPILLEDLKFACDETGATPLFVLNMITGTSEDQLEMLRHAAIIGLPVKYVELDNEVYLGDNFYVNRFPTGVDYGNEANAWIKLIKKSFPDVKISVVGYSARVSAGKSKKKHFVRTESWNRDVLSVIEGADAMTFHVYGGNGLGSFASESTDEESEPGDDSNELQKAFDNESSIPYILGIPFNRWKNSDTYDYPLLPSGMKVWISEYNLFEKEGVVAGTWAHGLYAVTQTMLYFENPRTGMICYHNLTTSAQFAAIFNNDKGFNKAVKKKENQPFDLTAAGYCLSLFGKLVNDGGTAAKIKFSNNELLSGLRSQKYPSLYGWMVSSGKNKKVLVINLSGDPVISNFSSIIKSNGSYSQISSNPQTQVASEKDVVQKNGKGTSVVLMPYSVTIIEGE